MCVASPSATHQGSNGFNHNTADLSRLFYLITKFCPDKRSTNHLYGSITLVNYDGDLFYHKLLKWKQLNFCDVNNKLISPNNWYLELRQGTLNAVMSALLAFNWESHQCQYFRNLMCQ